MAFKDHFPAAMEAAGYNQSSFARSLQKATGTTVSPSAISQWCKGPLVPDAKKWDAVADLLNVDVNTIGRWIGKVQRGAEGLATRRLAPDDGRRSVSIPEYDVSARGGVGGPAPKPLDWDGTHHVVHNWKMPADFMGANVSPGAGLVIIKVIGDSMEPAYWSGERVLVDTAHKVPSPPGTYVLWDGAGVIIKHCEIVMNSDPMRVRVSSANRDFASYEVLLSELIVNGRVAGKWMWK